jgi:hypothetical protein
MRLLLNSEIYTFPGPSTATLPGLYNLAKAALPPSPLNPVTPDPAMVVMIPVDAAIFRMR